MSYHQRNPHFFSLFDNQFGVGVLKNPILRTNGQVKTPKIFPKTGYPNLNSDLETNTHTHNIRISSESQHSENNGFVDFSNSFKYKLETRAAQCVENRNDRNCVKKLFLSPPTKCTHSEATYFEFLKLDRTSRIFISDFLAY